MALLAGAAAQKRVNISPDGDSISAINVSTNDDMQWRART
jgi:hypothetical protein